MRVPVAIFAMLANCNRRLRAEGDDRR